MGLIWKAQLERGNKALLPEVQTMLGSLKHLPSDMLFYILFVHTCIEMTILQRSKQGSQTADINVIQPLVLQHAASTVLSQLSQCHS